ncbi:MAG: alpha amylase C-terminal domain-containing protein, partial [Verrucomicrobia bacterium]|nr:alpha amylase C-terminal domain-containing protein [Verrucomicrobiota bacterium]
GKGSLLQRMAGDDWQKFANLRTLLGYQWVFPGKQLLFMGCEFGQSAEWNADAGLDWHLLQAGPYHCGLQKLVADLNHLYRAQPAFWLSDFDPHGFAWIDCADTANSILSFIRRDTQGQGEAVVILNLTPVPRHNYRIGLPRQGEWREALNSDAKIYGGSGMGNLGRVTATEQPRHSQPFSANFTLPPLSILVFTSAHA